MTDTDKATRIRAACLAAAAAFLFLLGTSARLPFWDAVRRVDANDVYSYVKLSAAAAGGPEEPVLAHFAQRFLPHYAVGGLSRLSGLSMDNSYTVVSLLLLAGVLLTCALVLMSGRGPAGPPLLLFFVAVLSPYAFRLNFLVSGILADSLFALGLALTLLGFVRKRPFLAVVGTLAAASGKQMALLVLPGLVLYAYAAFRERFGRNGAGLFALFLAAAVPSFGGLLSRLSAGFSGGNLIDLGVLLGFFPWLFSGGFSFRLLAEHLVRIVLPALPFVLLALAPPRKGAWCAYFTLENAALLLIVLGPMSYAFLPGPELQMGNQSRYVALAVLPLAMLTLNMLPTQEIVISPRDALLLVPVLGAYSYHHKYCFLQSDPGMFLTAHLAGLAALFYWLRGRYRAPQRG